MSLARVLAASALAACIFAAPATPLIAKEKPPENWDGLEKKKVKGAKKERLENKAKPSTAPAPAPAPTVNPSIGEGPLGATPAPPPATPATPPSN